MNYKCLDALEVAPVIAAVKEDGGVDACLKSERQVVFILYGDTCTIPEIVSKVKAAGKLAVVHLDLIHGLASKNIAADFIKKIYRSGWCNFHKTDDHSSSEGTWNAHGIARIFD